MFFDCRPRRAIHVRGDQVAKGGGHVVHLQDEIPGLQRRRRMIGEALTEIREFAQYRQTDR